MRGWFIGFTSLLVACSGSGDLPDVSLHLEPEAPWTDAAELEGGLTVEVVNLGPDRARVEVVELTGQHRESLEVIGDLPVLLDSGEGLELVLRGVELPRVDETWRVDLQVDGTALGETRRGCNTEEVSAPLETLFVPVHVDACLDDADEDGHLALACGGDDCDDDDPGAHPGADEVCNEVDDDCDGEVDTDAIDALPWYPDVDEDGWGDPAVAAIACDAPSGWVEADGDCDDLDASVHPAAEEICNGVDDDCSGGVDDLDELPSW